MRKSSISQDLVKLVPRLKTWNWEKQRWGRVYLVVHIPIASDTFPPWTPDVTEGCSGVDFYSTEWNCAARRKHMQVQGERGERTQERKGENDGGRLLRRRVFGGGVREWEEREARKESVWRGGGGKRVKERERPQSCYWCCRCRCCSRLTIPHPYRARTKGGDQSKDEEGVSDTSVKMLLC